MLQVNWSLRQLEIPTILSTPRRVGPRRVGLPCVVFLLALAAEGWTTQGRSALRGIFIGSGGIGLATQGGSASCGMFIESGGIGLATQGGSALRGIFIGSAGLGSATQGGSA